MGMHFGLIAVKGDVSELQESFTSIWDKFELSDARAFSTLDEAWAWKLSNEKFVAASNWSKDDPGQETYMLWRDGQWAVLMDLSFVLATDKQALASLSEKFGIALSFIVESTSGCAYFLAYESGKEIRAIENNGESIEMRGSPVSQEVGIDIGNYYMSETEALLAAYEITAINALNQESDYRVISVIDRTDYSWLANEASANSNVEVENLQGVKKQWWKFW